MENENDRDIHCGQTESGEKAYEVDYEQGESVSVVTAETVARLEEKDPTATPPIHEAVDGDALDRLVSHAWRRQPGHVLTITFTYYSYRVTVDHPGTIRLVELK